MFPRGAKRGLLRPPLLKAVDRRALLLPQVTPLSALDDISLFLAGGPRLLPAIRDTRRIANRARRADDGGEDLGEFAANTSEQAVKAEIEQARQAAHEARWKQGFDAGQGAAYDEARAEIASLIRTLQTGLTEADAEKSRPE